MTTDDKQLEICKYHGFLSGYVQATGRAAAFPITAITEDAMQAYNTGFDGGYAYGHRMGRDALIEWAIALKTHAYCASCSYKQHVVAGGWLPRRIDVRSICRPS